MKRFDLEKLDKSIIYAQRMADGRVPYSNQPMEDGILNNPNVIRCMFFIEDVLKEVKANGGIVGGEAKGSKTTYEVKKEARDNKLAMVDLIDSINEGINPITGETFNESNLLEDKAFINAITQLYKKYVVQRTDKPGRAGEAWSKEEDAQLKEEFSNRMSMAEMTKVHERSSGAIQRRLEKYHLLNANEGDKGDEDDQFVPEDGSHKNEDSPEISVEEMALLSELRNPTAKAPKKEKRSCDNCKLYLNESCGGLKGMCEDYEYAPVITEEEKKAWPTEMKGPYGKNYGRNRRRKKP